MRVEGTWRFADASWDDALGELERLARAAGDSVVLALSGSETVEVASALSQLVRKGFGSHRVVLPEETSTALDAHRAPLSAIADAEIVVVIGDDPVRLGIVASLSRPGGNATGINLVSVELAAKRL